ncbi:hypothetical protein AX16_004613 [Volvariella volvacea WC 439]|nr:hypothetical protein AX16_004613 [Volvariella volvacea WC 439]
MSGSDPYRRQGYDPNTGYGSSGATGGSGTYGSGRYGERESERYGQTQDSGWQSGREGYDQTRSEQYQYDPNTPGSPGRWTGASGIGGGYGSGYGGSGGAGYRPSAGGYGESGGGYSSTDYPQQSTSEMRGSGTTSYGTQYGTSGQGYGQGQGTGKSGLAREGLGASLKPTIGSGYYDTPSGAGTTTTTTTGARTGYGSGGDRTTKPGMGERILGGTEAMAGQMMNKPEWVARGHEHQYGESAGRTRDTGERY